MDGEELFTFILIFGHEDVFFWVTIYNPAVDIEEFLDKK